jgi:hypothetical protein
MRLVRFLTSALLVAVLATPSAAQRRAADLNGKLVRVTAPNFADHVVVGTVTSYTQEGLGVTEQGSGTERLFPLRSIERLDIFRGGDARAAAPRRARGYGFIGFGLGALAGPVLAITTDSDMVTSTLATSAGGLALGLAVGALSGTAHPTEQWSWNLRPWGYDPSLRPAQP